MACVAQSADEPLVLQTFLASKQDAARLNCGKLSTDQPCRSVQNASPGAPPTSYAGPSTFSTPAGINAQNVNSQVKCSK